MGGVVYVSPCSYNMDWVILSLEPICMFLHTTLIAFALKFCVKSLLSLGGGTGWVEYVSPCSLTLVHTI